MFVSYVPLKSCLNYFNIECVLPLKTKNEKTFSDTRKYSDICSQIKQDIKNSLLDDYDCSSINAKLEGVIKATNLEEPTPEAKFITSIHFQNNGLKSNEDLNNFTRFSKTDEVDACRVIVWIDYYLKALHLHNCLETEADSSDDTKWCASHKTIKKLDLKVPILLGDLFNFKAMKIASTLGSKYEPLTKVQELLSKLSFENSKVIGVSTSTSSRRDYIYGLYYYGLQGLGYDSKWSEQLSYNALNSHPKDSILSYQTKYQ